MKDCFWCASHVGIAHVQTPQGNVLPLCRDCRAINAREMKGGA